MMPPPAPNREPPEAFQCLQDQWTAVDRYLTDLLVPPDSAALDAALAASVAAGLSPINVSPNQGKFLHLLARMHCAKNILEIGTLGGYSTIWLARALPPEGRLVTLEFDPKRADIARSNLKFAGLEKIVELRVGKGHRNSHPNSPPKTVAPSTSSSSTPTNPVTPTTSPGLSNSPNPAP